ncbi:MAG: hypothetical protein KIT35_01490 [Piscinibacter sp.]|uniref:hypothetical protein n=1 Tax=Piscinibacter sp. TaxID=1903157 RepID=UPI00258BCA83|nr:hypothetical protein [Piscinibacter sp.]MCW5662481.1 hypothetical protein [Piscinibacter sp.]
MSEPSFTWPRRLGLRAGEWVVVRSKEEILATLDARAELERMPFQPEMLAFCGQRLRVAKVAHKTCDTINKTGGRSVKDAVHLEAARCDGAAHGGCMADCMFFWKEAWLRRPDDTPGVAPASAACDDAALARSVVRPGEEGKVDPAWSCQTTALYDASGPLAWWDLRQYVRDVASGNHSAWHMTRLLIGGMYRRLVNVGVGYRVLVGLYNQFQKLRGGKPFPVGSGTIPDGKPTPLEVLDLKPGEWVEVKPAAEILSTITASGFNRGMRYDMEMAKYSGERFRVEKRVQRLINEQTGKMVPMKSACIQLENVYCRAECTPMRLGCPRASNTYWREIWLKRVDGPGQG